MKEIRMSMRKYIKNILSACILFAGATAFAGELQPVTGILKSTIANPVILGDTVTISVAGVAGTADYRIRNIISLKLDQNTDTFLTAATNVMVRLRIYRWDKTNVSISPNRTEDLNVSVNNRYNQQTIDMASLKLEDGYKVKVVIDSIFINGTSTDTLPRFVYVESEIRLTRYYDFSSYVNTDISDISITAIDTDCDSAGIDDELEINWGTVTGAEEYQLEWIYVNNYGTTGSTYLSTSRLLTDFKNNSTRITTIANTYRISLTYEKGYIAFRARAVGRDYLDPETYMYSIWSEADTGRMSTVSANARYQVVNAHENDKNWQYSSTFAEEGKKKEVISYFDGSLHNRQSVTKVNSDKNVIVGETLYDYQGRPAVNVLPVPVNFPNCTTSVVEPSLKYYERFNVNSDSAAYSKADFDVDDTTGTCNQSIPGMDTTSGASQYYSGNNPDKTFQQAFLPDAKLYPFSQVEYTPDNTGRVRSQSGVGEEFQLGSGHETKYLYGQPNQIQLDRLFGSEAGDASHYKKNTVIDANGQTSVSYLNQEGKTVATALAGNPPTDINGVFMEALSSEATGTDTLTIDLFKKNSSGVSPVNRITSTQDGIEFSTQLTVAYTSVYKFSYDLTVNSFSDSCMRDSICMSCIYDLEIKITDECGTNLVSPVINKPVGHLDSIPDGFTMTCTDSSGAEIHDTISVNLTAGSYTVSKVLRLNSDARNYYVEQYMDTTYNSCTRTLADFIAEELAALDTTLCHTSCSACVAALGTKDDFVASGQGTEMQYDMLYEQCLEPCTEESLCESSYQMMLMDVSPGGQYGKFDPVTVTSPNTLSVFNPVNSLNPNAWSGNGGNWKKPKVKLNGSEYGIYMDDNGNRTKIILGYNDDSTSYSPEVDNISKVYTDASTGDKYTYPENLKHLRDFMPVWNPYFARSLVTYHPEYVYYLACSDQSKTFTGDTMSSNDFDSLLYACTTFQDAIDNGFIKSNYDSLTIDPDDKITELLTQSSAHLYDPFFTNSGYSLQYPAPFSATVTLSQAMLQGEMEDRMASYAIINSIPFSIPEIAATMARCGSNFTALPTAECMAFGTDYYPSTVTNYAAKNDSIRDREWNFLKTFYLSEKRKLQYERMDFYALYYNRLSPYWYGGCNACIQNSAFNMFAAGMTSPSTAIGYPSSQAYNKRQPCSNYSAGLYSTYKKRFAAPADLPGVNEADVPYLMYQQTGQCPMAFMLQNFLNEMAQDSLLNSAGNVSLSTIENYGPDMYAAFNGGTAPSLFTNYYWDFTTDTDSVLKALIKHPDTGSIICSMSLDINGSPISNFADITGIQNLTFDSLASSLFVFNAVAVYNIGDTATGTAAISGSTCLNIKDCNFVAPCTGNQFAADYANLVNILLLNEELYSTGSYIGVDTMINPFISSTIKNMLGTPNSDIKWKFTSPGTYELYDSTNTSTKLKMTVLSMTPSVSTGIIGGFINIRSDHNNLFKMDVIDTAGTLVSILTGKMEKVTAAGTTGISMGECAFPASPECSTEEHQVREDLETLLNEFLVNDSLNDIDLFSQVNFSALLKSYISDTLLSTGSIYTYDTTALNSYDTLRFDMEGTCAFELYHNVNDTNAIANNFTDLVAITDLTGIEPMDANGNFYDFYFIGIYNNGGSPVSDTIRGTSCWPLKNCDDCDSTMITPAAMDSNVVSIPLVYNGWTGSTSVTAIDTMECDTAYQGFIAVLQNYNNSSYAIANSDSLNEMIIPTFNLFMQSGYCDCSYTDYLQEYVDDTTGTLPLPVDINHYEFCDHTGSMKDADRCKSLHTKYAAAVAAYNRYIDENPSLHYSKVDTVYSGAVFLSKYCYCGEKFISSLTAIMNGYHPDSIIVYELIQLENSCVTAACVPAGPDTLDFVFPPATYSPDPCVQQMLNIAALNAQNAYGQYIDSISTSIAKRYTEHCLDALEDFQYSYTDKEYHFTLYYYDQAGNLVKTIPPEGVEILDIDSTNDALEQQIIQDRQNNTHTVFTNHRLATNYEYNSLNQLVYQDMPDHDKMSMIDFTLPNGLDSRVKILRTQFVNASKGYLTGSTGGRGYLYTTDNGGNNWTRVNNTVATDLNDVHFASATIGYAVGNDGIILKTTNGGSDWDAKNRHSTYQGDFYSVYFSSATAGVIGGARTATAAATWYTTDGGTTYTSGTSADFAIGDTITSITFDGSNYYATVKNNGEGKIYKSADSYSWDEMTQKKANDLSRVRYLTVAGGVIAYAVGADGTLLKTPLNSTSSWQLAATGISNAFRDIYFSTEDEGVAVIDSVAGKGQIWKTFDGGKTWELLSPPGSYYTAFQEYTATKLLACGENGLISKVLISTAPFGIINMKQPSYVNDLKYADGVMYSGNPQVLAVGNNDTIYYTENAGLSDLTWTKVKTSSYGVSSGDANFKKVMLKDSLNTLLKGMLLTENGKLYSLYKNAGDTFSFSIAAIKDLSGGTISSYFFNDVTMDSHTSSQYFAYDTISKRAFRGSITSGTATFVYIDTTTAQQVGVQSIAVDSAAGNLLLAGSKGIIKHKSSPGSTTTAYSNLSYNVKAVPLNGISARYDNELYAAGDDGSVWGTSEGLTWKLLNTGMSEDINKIKIKPDSTVGMLACDNGKLYRQNAIDSSSIALTLIDVGTEENLTALAIKHTEGFVGTSEGKLIYLPSVNAAEYTNVNILHMSGSFNAMAFPTFADQVCAVGDNAAVYNALESNSAKITNLFLPLITGMSFADANNGYITSQKSDLRRTTDGGTTWTVIVPETVPTTMWNLFATQTDQAVLIGSNKYLSVINGDLSPVTITVTAGSAGVDLTTIDFNKEGYGVIAGEERNVYSLVPSGNTFTVTHLGQTAAGSPAEYKFSAAKVFPDNSFLVAGEQSQIYYYNGSAFTGQMNHDSLFDNPSTQAFTDIFFHDDRTGYISGTKGVVLKCSMSSNIMDGAGATLDAIVWDTLNLMDPYGIYDAAASDTITINTIDFVDRHHGFLGGLYNTNPANAKFAMLIDDNSNYYSTRFFYDKLGRMVVSQNTKQYNKSPKAFSYTKYDALGRVKEVGEKSENADSIGFYKIFGSDVGGMFNSNTINDDSLSTWLAGDGARKEVTRTYYDTVVFNDLPIVQENLRGRIVDVTYEDINDDIDSTYQHATHFTYNMHGHVNTFLLDNPMINTMNQRYKRLDYVYDLISGNVNKVIYQSNAPDLFIHKYEYDADDRITRVETSTDDIIYQTDAKYFYYHHGPLARVEYGKNQVQGMDYAYTLQGWIKGVNSNTVKSNRDMGQDGLNDTSNLNQYFAEDAMGYTLGYFAGDYKAISGVKWSSVTNRFEAQTAGAQFAGQRHDLFNGNISHMVTTIVETNADSATSLAEAQTALPLANAYKYDQLNRLKKSLSFNNVSIPSNLWSASGQTVSNMYENTFTYDANGNILTQNRFDETGVKFENMDYRYKKDANGNFMQNRLYHVNDSASSGLETDDIDDQGAFVSTIASINTVNNYRYDEIGNLIADSTEQIDTIKWTVYGKIKEIKRTSGSSKKNLKFDYDASNSRIAKQILSSAGSWEKTIFYVRDAQGNVMSTYEESVVDSSFTYKLKEQHLYGSSRIGMVNPEKEMIGADTTNEFAFDTLNKRQYEIVNHLRNVLTVTYDRKIAVDTNNDGLCDLRLADLVSQRDYSPFGGKLHGRGFEIESYRYDFNSKESDLETETQDYGMRIYNPSLGKFLSVDPLFGKFAYYSSYQFAGNTPIQALDLDGEEILNYKTPYRLELGGTQLKIKYSYSDDYQESWKMAETASIIRSGLAGQNGEKLPLDIPIYPAQTNQQLYEINEAQKSIYGKMTEEMGESTGERDGQGMAAEKKKGETGTRPKTAQKIMNNAEAKAAGIEWICKKAFSETPLAKSVEAKYDINRMVKAYNEAWNMVEKTFDFTEAQKAKNWTDAQVNQYKVDIANFVVDGKLPNNASPEYSRAVSNNGMTIINSNKKADAQIPLQSTN
jgi:RHS repeat-associated protein